jgi:predicted nucleic acid-binding protein
MKLRVYTDTSAFSAYFDERAADRKSLTREFWQNLGAYECATSELAVEELRQTADLQLRTQMESLLAAFQIIAVTDDMRRLAEKYLLAGAFTRTMYNDAVHVAAATLSRQDVLVSWNFKHLVNRRRRAMVGGVNATAGLPPIDILSPPEL